ncbi:MAG: carboxypeptidase-like regulatory domain-containing protein, partial [Dysgonamonadaceae bacterium]|nr:carboxypeptidase-like regulatory domain-containing protein [Dysgonamonadaceae bacterium]
MSKKNRKIAFALFGLMLVHASVFAQTHKFTVSGNVRDTDDGEDLIGVSIAVVQAENLGTATNPYGFYSISLPEGRYTLRFSYIGYAVREMEVDLTADNRLNVTLKSDVQQLQEVVVNAQSRNINVSNPTMSIDRISAAIIKKIPVLLGEVDVIKAIQLLPGVQVTSEGSSGFSVRGGGYDQNLILLDEATVYSPSHLMGFFSVFNNDAVKDVTLYKGDIPASYGGRLASMMDIRSKDGNSQRFSGTGGIGLIASRLTLEGPIVKDKSSFIVSGRRTYADLFMKLANSPDMRNTSLYFYDLNVKINYRINDNNRLFLSGYLGRDNLSTDYMGMNFGNKTATLRWNHIFSPKLFSNFTLIGSLYNYALGNSAGASLMQEWKSKMQDYGLKADFTYHLNPRNHIRFGYSATHHTLVPSEGGGGSISGQVRQPKEFALEHAAYLSNEMKVTDRLILKYGLRYSLFQNISNGEAVNYLNRYEMESVESHKRGTVYH